MAQFIAIFAKCQGGDSNVALDSHCESAVADIDVQLKHRHSLRPNLFKTVKAFTAHERGT